MSPIQLLIRSRKFWLLIVDTMVSIISYFAVHYLSPDSVEMVRFLILALQPVFLMVIYSIAYEDAARTNYETEQLK